MEDLIRIHDRYYILATSGFSDDRTRVLKQADSFVVFDRFGDIHPVGLGQQGLFDHGTRYLSRLELRVAGVRPLLLSSTVEHDNAVLVASLTNPDIRADGRLVVPRNTVYLERAALLWDGACYARLVIRNFALEAFDLSCVVLFAADFADIFEVRGVTRAARGTLRDPEVEGDLARLVYDGLDGVTRATTVRFSPAPVTLTGERAEFPVHLPPAGEATLSITIECNRESRRPARRTFDEATHAARGAIARNNRSTCTIHTSSRRFNDWLARSAADLAMMVTETADGLYPYAGVPWFCCPFGRDGVITALETLWVAPEIARGVLRFLAATQATAVQPDADAEPGKIIHEMRAGEMAALGEIPFARYYGSVDATPLFVLLAEAYWARTGDVRLIQEIWPQIGRALEWIDHYGDRDGDGFVEYARHAHRGLRNQGWKDSEDALFHADGSLADGPIALCEVQAYVYGAKRGAARLARALGDPDRAHALLVEARSLQARFEERFWLEDLGCYALALDGSKRPCAVRTSNAGHCLLTGIARPARARAVAASLLDDDMFSGWGVRTVAADERRYNPMSYHNGSVWPHDNALLAAGLARYQLQKPVEKILEGLFDACMWFDLQRLPELFCGFPRRPGTGPTLYPVACAPQAWAAGAVYLLLSACLGLSIDGPERRVRFSYSRLPRFLEAVWVTGLQIDDALVDLELRRYGDDVGVNVTRRDGSVEVVVVK